VKTGGYLLYNTCTLTLLENEGIVSYAIDKLGYKLISAWDRLEKLFPNRFIEPNNSFESELSTGIPSNNNLYKEVSILNENLSDLTQESHIFKDILDLQKYHTLSEIDSKKVCRSYPTHPKTTGYFFALLQKV
jgi:16S rRNA C967 or C1407 C5-methylase (RsmB/RsmF family)